MADTGALRDTDERAINTQVIEEFRRNGGNVGGQFENAKMVILRTTGAKSGQERLTPLAYVEDNDRIHVFAAGPGLPHHPAWYHNVLAHPDVTVEIGPDTLPAVARILTGEDRARIWDLFVADIPELPGWQSTANREFPIIELTPVPQ